MITAALIDDHVLFRDVLKTVFEQRGGPRVVGESSRSDEVLDLVAATRPDVVLLDIMFPTGRDGIEVAADLVAANSGQRIIFVTMVKDVARIAQALRAGAQGYVTKDQTVSELIQAVNDVVAGRQYLSPSAAAAVNERGKAPEGLASLTWRERQVFQLIVSGLTSREAAKQLSISPRTIETHRSRLMSKLGVHSAAELIRLAARLGLID